MSETRESVPGIAIIGMACRVPGAPNIDAFWQNLKNGVESISFFSERELLASGIDPALLGRPDYVRAAAMLDSIDQFDAAFFGVHPREAEITDPQQRLFLECAYTALEDAGYNSENYAGLMGVYAGVGPNIYVQQILSQPELVRSLGLFQIGLANEKDFLAPRLAYKLNLRGPSASVQTACSTSLVAVHLACQSLLNYEADIMLAGAASLRAEQKAGYLYQDGGIYSRDGHCRAFDADASGSVASSGVGVVVLKRLADALADGDSIHAVIRSSAVNNDGALKLGFTAPSQDGQAAVIGEAIALAGIDPETIGYIEAHGTGTRLGDSIEIAALKQAFRHGTAKQQFCAIGSVKTNIGHLDAAAGIAGLIKTVLALKHQQLPPSLHFERPNPQIDFADSPFYVNTRLSTWPSDNQPRRAGVSAFGIGGTNAHLLLEAAPPGEALRASGAAQLLTLSAQTPQALAAMAANLADHLSRHPEFDLANVAYTLHVGRRAFAHRVALVCRTTLEAIDGLRRQDAQRLVDAANAERERGVVFLFPGQGAQYPGMTRELYASEPIFRHEIDRCATMLMPHGLDLRAILYATADAAADPAIQLSQTAIVQPALFAVEYALAQLWQSWGIVPQALLGHSLGEYVAATLAGVFSLEDALLLVALRGRLMQHLPRGSMLAIPLGESEVQSLLHSAEPAHQLSLAAINGPASCVVAGAPDAITVLTQRLKDQAIPSQPLVVAQAFHSPLLEPMLEPFLAALKRIPLHPPQIPYISNLTGTWITADQVTDPVYWIRQLRETVRFSAGIETLCQISQPIFLEVGPGHTLTNLIRQHPARSDEQIVLASLRQPGTEHTDVTTILGALGQLWQAGIAVDWAALHAEARPRRVPLPTYPFERQRYWIAATNLRQISAPAPQTEHLMFKAQNTAQPASTRHAPLLAALRSLVNRLTGIDPDAIDIHQSWFEAGLDSLLLLQFNQALQETWNVRIPLAQLLEEYTTLDRIAAYLNRQLPPEDHAEPTAVAPTAAPQPAQLAESTQATSTIPADASGVLERVIAQQLQLMAQQLSLFNQAQTMSSIQPIAPAPEPQRRAHSDESRSFVPYQPLETPSNFHLSEQQRRYLQDFIARYTTRTQRSKQLAQQYRPVLADSRWTAGFRLAWKELIYPLIGQRSAESRIWDVDDNEYVDFTMGFGVHLFGHSPRWLMDAIDEQLKLGVQLGPQSQLAGEVAGLICELTGVERVTFCNSGTEAVMGALRIARAVTGRTKIAYFAGAYHGWSDATLARQITVNGQRQLLPLASGVPAQAVQDVLVLPYADPESLDVIRAQAHQLAAVLVEPVQSRRPDLQPRDFLHALRELTQQAGIALIFDEVVSGFRVAPGGAQAWFGVQADLVTYGKIVGGGFPIGVIAGKAAYMDAFDGGMWHYGDDSYPQVEKTLFASAFFKHPLTMAAALAVLKQIKASGSALHDALNQRTASLAARLNSYFAAERVPLEVVYFSSLFRFKASAETQLLELFRYHLTHKGVHNWEGGNLFLSTAHSEADLEHLIQAVQATIEDLRCGGFLPQGLSVEPERQILSFPLTDTQQARWVVAQIAGQEMPIFNEPLNLRLRGPLDLPALHAAIQQVIDRHEALRITFGGCPLGMAPAEGDQQRVRQALSVELPVIDLSGLEHQQRDEQVATLIAAHARQPFNVATGPLFRFLLVRLSEHEHIFLTTLHHMITDSWSGAIIFKEISACYAAARQRQSVELPVPVQFSDYVTWLTKAQGQQTQAAAYWQQRFADAFPILALPTDHPRPALPSFRGTRTTAIIEPELTQQIKHLARQQGCSLLMVLLAGWNLLLHRVTGQHDLVVGVPVAGQPALPNPYLVGCCSTLLPLRSRLTAAQTCCSYLADVRRTVLEALDEQHYPFSSLARQLSAGQTDRQIPLIRAMFNLEPRGNTLAFYELDVQPIPHVHGFARYDIALNVVELDDRLELACDYATDLFENRTIGRWLQSFQILLAGMARDPMAAVSHLPLLPDLNDSNAETEHTPPRTPVEEQIAAVWRDLLNIQQVGVQDNFFASGGDSLLAVRFIVRLREHFHIDLAVRGFFEQPTIAALAATIGAVLANSSQAEAPATGDP